MARTGERHGRSVDTALQPYVIFGAWARARPPRAPSARALRPRAAGPAQGAVPRDSRGSVRVPAFAAAVVVPQRTPRTSSMRRTWRIAAVGRRASTWSRAARSRSDDWRSRASVSCRGSKRAAGVSSSPRARWRMSGTVCDGIGSSSRAQRQGGVGRPAAHRASARARISRSTSTCGAAEHVVWRRRGFHSQSRPAMMRAASRGGARSPSYRRRGRRARCCRRSWMVEGEAGGPRPSARHSATRSPMRSP